MASDDIYNVQGEKKTNGSYICAVKGMVLFIDSTEKKCDREEKKASYYQFLLFFLFLIRKRKKKPVYQWEKK